MLAVIYAMNELHKADPEAAAALGRNYSGAVRRDLLFLNEYWKQFEGRAERISSDINDAYLKSNRQKKGINSYARMVELLLAEQRAGRLP
jgi:hypothetical protein